MENLMIILVWSISAAIQRYLRRYMPSNVALDALRHPRGLRRAVSVALAATAAYLYGASLCATIVERGGPGYLNVLVVLFFWNAMKFAWTTILAPARMLNEAARTRRTSKTASGVGGPASEWADVEAAQAAAIAHRSAKRSLASRGSQTPQSGR